MKSRARRRSNWRASGFLSAGALLFAFSFSSKNVHAFDGRAPALLSVSPPPGMPDPRRMSGIPRPDPNIPPGTLTVRCLLGSFAEPAVGVKVKLTLTKSDGSKVSREAVSAAQGRARFEELDEFFGMQGVVEAELGGAVVRSLPISILERSGTAILLVKGAGSGSSEPGPSPTKSDANEAHEGGGASDHGAGHDAIPPLGKPFVLNERDPGTLVVGALNIGSSGGGIQPLVGIKIEVLVFLPESSTSESSDTAKQDKKGAEQAKDAEAEHEGATKEAEGATPEDEILEGIVDAEGRATFKGLLPPKYPIGTRYQVRGVLEEGKDAVVSEAFLLDGKAKAIILTPSRGEKGAESARPARPAGPPPEMPPRSNPSLPQGTVQVQLSGAMGQPLQGNYELELSRHSMTGEIRIWRRKTNTEGKASFESIENRDGALFQVTTKRDGAPFGSRFFALPESVGADVELRTFETTSDIKKVRSAVHYDIAPLENDLARVTQVFVAMVEGEQAFWPDDAKNEAGWRVALPEGARSLRVLPDSSEYLEAPNESAPYALLTKPIPPGKEVHLSIAYLMPHSGAFELDWQAPFPLLGGQMSLASGVEAQSGVEDKAVSSPHGGPGVRNLKIAKGQRDLHFSIAKLPTTNRFPVYVAIALLVLTLLALVLAMFFFPRRPLRESLERKRDSLLAKIKSRHENGAGELNEEDDDVKQLNSIYRQLDVLQGGESK